MPHFLRKTHGSWSAGTRVEPISRLDDRLAKVRVLAGDKPIIEVNPEDLVERGKKS